VIEFSDIIRRPERRKTHDVRKASPSSKNKGNNRNNDVSILNLFMLLLNNPKDIYKIRMRERRIQKKNTGAKDKPDNFTI
jgi:hypothetical protein